MTTPDDQQTARASKLSSIASKLRALRQVTQENGATEAEALNAAAKYDELMQKYRLDETELDVKAEGTEHVRIDWPASGNGYDIALWLGVNIGRFTNCKTWRTVPHGRGRLASGGTSHFLGMKSDVELAEWLTRSLVGFVQAEAVQFAWSNEGVTQAEVHQFVTTAGQRIGNRLQELINGRTTGSGGLVVVRKKMVDEAFAALGLNLSFSRQAAVQYTGRGASAGFDVGNRAQFARPADFKSTLKITSN